MYTQAYTKYIHTQTLKNVLPTYFSQRVLKEITVFKEIKVFEEKFKTQKHEKDHMHVFTEAHMNKS